MEDWLYWTTAIMEKKHFVLTEIDTYTVFVFVFLHVMLLPKPPFVDFTEYHTHCHDISQSITPDEDNFFTPK